MTVYAAFPNTIRKYGAAGISGGPQNNIVSFQPEVGSPIVRRRSSSFVSKYRVNYDALTKSEYDAFVSFFRTTLADGTLPFLWRHPMTNALHRCRMDISGENAYEERRRTGTLYDISFNLLVINTVDTTAYDLMQGDGDGYAFNFIRDTFAAKAGTTIELDSFSAKIPNNRSSVATYVNSAGLLVTAAANTWRPGHPSTGGARIGIKYETRASTNEIQNSELFTAAEFVNSQLVLTAASGTAPDGANTAFKIKPNNVNAQHRIQTTKTLTAAQWGLSVWFKAAEYGYGFFSLLNPDLTSVATVRFNLTDGTVSTSNFTGSAIGAVISMEQYLDGWWRCALSFTATAEAWFVRVGVSAADSYLIADGNSVKGLLMWGLQLEKDEVSSYIKTSGAIGTRAAETIVYDTGSGTSYPSNVNKGTVFADIYSETSIYSGYSPFVFRLGGAVDFIRTIFNGAVGGTVVSQFNNVGATNINSTIAASFKGRLKMALGWSGTTDAALTVNSETPVTITSYELPPDIVSTTIGVNLNAIMRTFVHYSDKLDNVTLESMST